MNFHSLFWKIFLSFWLFMALFGASSALLVAHFKTVQGPKPLQTARLLRHLQGMMRRNADRELISDWLRQYQDDVFKIYIVDEKGDELLQRVVPEALLQALKEKPPMPLRGFSRFSRPGMPPLMDRAELEQPLFIKPVVLNGELFHLLIDNRRLRGLARLFHPFGIAGRIVIAFILSGAICFFLASYLIIPIKKLQSATHRIAGGQFSDSIQAEIIARKDEIGDLGRDFEYMAKRIESALLSQQRLLRDVSHELRSPLARLQIALGLAHQRSNGLIEPELDRIELEVERLNDLVAQSLSLARLNNQIQLAEKKPLNLNEILIQAVLDADYEAQEKQCRVVLAESAQCTILGDSTLMLSALENLLRNAVNYTPVDTQVEVSIELSDDEIVVTISDQGDGVPEESLDDLFKPFFRVDEARTHLNGGYGIGLAIAERAVHLHQGRIQASNSENGGLIMRIVLPLLIDFPLGQAVEK